MSFLIGYTGYSDHVYVIAWIIYCDIWAMNQIREIRDLKGFDKTLVISFARDLPSYLTRVLKFDG